MRAFGRHSLVQRVAPTPSRHVSYSAARTTEAPKFDVVDVLTPAGADPCVECGAGIVDTYYEADDGLVCSVCHSLITSAHGLRTPRTRFARALGFGTIAAALSIAAYFGLLAAIDREVNLALVLVGFAVGRAVRIGAGRPRGLRYQWLALGLTYLAIVATYVPFVLKGASATDVGALLLLALAAPALEGIDHGLTLIMIAIALGQAWRTNRRVDPKLTGPFRVAVNPA
jgi:hypothetical protein